MIKTRELPEISFSADIFMETGPFEDKSIHYADVVDFLSGVASLAYVGGEWCANYEALRLFLLDIEENREVYDALALMAEIGQPVSRDEYWKDKIWPVLTDACNIGAHFLNSKE